ncbi:hypothetical protein Ddye_029171 [Dipteronia dyeriana]|uniref:Myb/SANT-like DNA-binding domain-containing protein n=1 Tax=Dipteronia dyeriana TaxID=168575 RepID=A0AAD9WKC5_9ROSI|nr:hypothetical protein Ddye_029171 [Dipteronia dyeriana]
MDKENNQVENNPSLLSIIKESEDQSPKKPCNNSNNNTNDRLKRDEWSEGAVSSLLEAYESKWVLRNRAKLKGHDWEDVARHVSFRVNNTKSPKTQTQCKNKIESMKKRYRSESANADGSSWLLYPRLDLLLRGTNSVAAAAAVPPLQQHHHHHQQQQQQLPLLGTAVNPGALMLMEPSSAVLVEPPAAAAAAAAAAPPPPVATAQNSHGSNGVDGMAKEDGVGTKLLSDHVSSEKKANMETDSSTPAADLYSHGDKDKLRSKKLKMKMEKNNKRIRKREEWEIAESIRWLAEVMVRSEQARMDTMREIEKMRAEAEAKRGELDLKRTQIIANTQLEIAKLFAASGKPVDSSLRIGRN